VVSDNKLIGLLIIIVLIGFALGRRFQRSRDLWLKWTNTLAALPGMEKDAKKGRWLFIKGSLVVLLVLAIAIRIKIS
jgi:hypothetical protein